MKYKYKKDQFVTYMYKKKKIEGNRYFCSPNVKIHW